jgi:BMFP domain-containing protein YqiC
MFTRLFGTSVNEDFDAARDSLRDRYNSWRFRRDIAAITATFDRLSDRRLNMIGMRREELFEAISDLMIRAEEERQIGLEVIALLEAPKAETTASQTGAPQTGAAISAGATRDVELAAAAA